MHIVECTYEVHAPEILAILNDVIATSTALFDYEPRPPASMAPWFAAKRAGGFPVLGAVAQGRLLGFATYGTFRAWPAYKYSVEHSVYVHRDERGRGVGGALMRALFTAAERQELHTLIAGIDADNRASIAFHERLGFNHAGTVKQAGFKFGRWLDLAFYQRLLPTPRHPVDGSAANG
jgi:phosphinothricin acetyltransferase